MPNELRTDEAVMTELGERLERRRLERNETQDDLAARAGVSRSTVIRIEQGRGGTVKALLRILRAHGLLRLDALVPPPAPSPIELLERQGRQRRRASGRRERDGSAREGDQATDFQWGTT
jgi:transcriptional regulator with XRE-family HTH domain